MWVIYFHNNLKFTKTANFNHFQGQIWVFFKSKVFFVYSNKARLKWHKITPSSSKKDFLLQKIRQRQVLSFELLLIVNFNRNININKPKKHDHF